jgi:molybdopterin-guanine dinucleotide biosynthesis protein A
MKFANQAGGFVLAGGESSRMGRDKALLELNGAPLLVRTARLVELVAGSVTIVAEAGRYEKLGLRVVGDDWPGGGPLGAIATAMRVAETPWNLIVACDLPYLTPPWLEYLTGRALESDAEAVIPATARGIEPLCAVYHERCEPAIREALADGTRNVTDGLKNVRAEFIQPAEWKAFDSQGFLFKNMNSPEDYAEARARLEPDAGAKPFEK